MEQYRKIWTLAQEIMQVLGSCYGPSMAETAASAGLKPPEWFLLLPTLLFAPDPVSAGKLGVRVPYTAPQTYHNRLRSLAEANLLQPVNENEFCLTAAGRQIIDQIVKAAYAAMSAQKPMPPADLTHLAALLTRLVSACEAAPEPPRKWGLRHSRRLKIPQDAARLIFIDQYLSDLSAYRDDAHLAAWQSHDLPAAAWETFTLLWRGEAQTLDELCLKLEHRGHGRAVYQAALAALEGRGWVTKDQEGFRLTKEGQTVRQAAEELTDSTFFAPWATLTDDELATFNSLMARLLEGLSK